MAAKAALRSNPAAAWSGGNSTTRKIVPFFGGSSTNGQTNNLNLFH